MPLERRNTIAAGPCHVTAPTNPRHSASFTTAATSSSYTSIKEAIAASRPTGGIASGAEITIRNHLVKQAAWAYLRPMSATPDSGSDHLLRRLASAVLSFPLFSLIRSAARAVVNVFGCFGF